MNSRAVLEFPTDYPLKIVGKPADEFRARVHAIVLRHAPDPQSARVGERPSANGRYVTFIHWEDLDPNFPDEMDEFDGPYSDVFVRDLQTNITDRVSLPFPGGPVEESGFRPAAAEPRRIQDRPSTRSGSGEGARENRGVECVSQPS